jgi:hypothetical protein
MRFGNKLTIIALGAGAAIVCGVTVASGGPVSVPAAPNEGGQVAAPAAGATSIAGTVYTPIAPCRILDTRHAAAGILQPGKPRTVQVSGSTGFAAQGGTTTGCGIPSYATSVSYSISAVNSTGTGFFRLWPTGTGEQNATALNYGKDAITSGASVQINPTTGPGVYLISHGKAANAVIDLNGYSAPQIQTGVTSVGVLNAPTRRIVSSVRTGTGHYTVTVDSVLTSCATSVTPDGGGYAATAYVSGSQVFVRTFAAASNTLADINFHLSALC